MAATVIKGKLPTFAKNFNTNDDEAGIPYDVTFVIKENVGKENSEDIEIAREVKAHKHILAYHSDVFKKMFFGPLKETNDIIPINETTYEAFEKLMEYIYQVDIECKDMALGELYEFVNLAEKYNMPELMKELKTQIEITPLTMQNLLDVVDVATRYSHFEEVSSALLLSCAIFFKKTVGEEIDKQMQFVLEKYGEGKERLALKLVSMVSNLPRTVCNNCGEDSCMTGQPVLHENLRKGLEVKGNNSLPLMTTLFRGKPWSMFNFTVVDVRPPNSVKLCFKDGSCEPRWTLSAFAINPLDYQQALCYDC